MTGRPAHPRVNGTDPTPQDISRTPKTPSRREQQDARAPRAYSRKTSNRYLTRGKGGIGTVRALTSYRATATDCAARASATGSARPRKSRPAPTIRSRATVSARRRACRTSTHRRRTPFCHHLTRRRVSVKLSGSRAPRRSPCPRCRRPRSTCRTSDSDLIYLQASPAPS